IPLGQRYRPGTMTVETRWSGLTVTDWLDSDVPLDDAATAPEAITLVRVLSGTVKARVGFAPRPEYAQVAVRRQPLGGGVLALARRGLCPEPSGAILAAATSSLPEEIGGVRNWDYRYCWLRDAAMTARVLVDLGSLAEAEAFLGWVDRCVERTGGHPERLHPL